MHMCWEERETYRNSTIAGRILCPHFSGRGNNHLKTLKLKRDLQQAPVLDIYRRQQGLSEQGPSHKDPNIFLNQLNAFSVKEEKNAMAVRH